MKPRKPKVIKYKNLSNEALSDNDLFKKLNVLSVR